eukprot:CAMPEP_0202742828 /NCGR_PEP_ID=MMETSP1388-20130828/5329_1 /ASSEMBLY_ACC=CAM_ASM_000864 /TAXON_ID=37098 /ORGANISM="Isochrysis sp, Strain CCMP1244" /LENGTH=293 /DNA_ID=CAMNT_0049409793 /DNA_START=73 /DNA_END=954 /DNA_ORIENTATION=-
MLWSSGFRVVILGRLTAAGCGVISGRDTGLVAAAAVPDRDREPVLVAVVHLVVNAVPRGALQRVDVARRDAEGDAAHPDVAAASRDHGSHDGAPALLVLVDVRTDGGAALQPLQLQEERWPASESVCHRRGRQPLERAQRLAAAAREAAQAWPRSRVGAAVRVQLGERPARKRVADAAAGCSGTIQRACPYESHSHAASSAGGAAGGGFSAAARTGTPCSPCTRCPPVSRSTAEVMSAHASGDSAAREDPEASLVRVLRRGTAQCVDIPPLALVARKDWREARRIGLKLLPDE